MKKRKWVVLMAVVLVVGIVVGVAASGLVIDIKAQLRKDFVVVVDDEVKEFKNVNGERVYPILYEGTTYLPIRAIGELMGKKVYWYEDDKRIELKEEKSTVTDADVIIPGTDDGKIDKPIEKPVQKPEYKPEADKSEFIGEEKAKKIALHDAGFKLEDVQFIKVELDYDNGAWQYEIEFRKDKAEYDYNIKAVDGTVIEKDVDYDD